MEHLVGVLLNEIKKIFLLTFLGSRDFTNISKLSAKVFLCNIIEHYLIKIQSLKRLLILNY